MRIFFQITYLIISYVSKEKWLKTEQDLYCILYSIFYCVFFQTMAKKEIIFVRDHPHMTSPIERGEGSTHYGYFFKVMLEK